MNISFDATSIFFDISHTLETDLSIKPIIHIRNVEILPATNEIKDRLSNSIDFDSEIKDDKVFLIDQNEIDLKHVIEYAAIKTFFSYKFLKLKGFMNMIFLIWFGNRHSRPKIAKFIQEILDYAAQIFYDTNGNSLDQMKLRIQNFINSIEFNTFYHEFLVSQAPHGQDSLYFLAFQSYFNIRFLTSIKNNFKRVISLFHRYEQDFNQTQIVPSIPEELKPFLIYSPFHIFFSRFQLTRYRILIQEVSNSIELRRFFQECSFISSFDIFDERIISFSLLCQLEQNQAIERLLKLLKEKEIINNYQILDFDSIINSFGTQQHETKFQKSFFDLEINDFFILNRIFRTGIPVIENKDYLIKYLRYNLKEQYKNIRTQFRQILKNSPNQYSHLNYSIDLITNEIQKDSPNDCLTRYILLKMNRIFEFDATQSLNLIGMQLFDTCSITIQGNSIFNTPELDSFIIGKTMACNSQGKPVFIRYIFPKSKILQFFYYLFRLSAEIISDNYGILIDLTDFMKNYDFQNQKWVFHIPKLEELPDSIFQIKKSRRSAKSLVLLESVKNNSFLHKSVNKKTRFFDYFLEFDYLISKRDIILQLLNKIYIKGQLIYPELPIFQDLKKKMRLNSKRGDRLNQIDSPNKRYLIFLTSTKINLNPVVNYEFIQSIFFDIKNIVSIRFFGGLWNGILILDIADRGELNLKYISELVNANIIFFDIFEILDEYRWLNLVYCYSREYSVRNFTYLMNFTEKNQFEVQRVEENTAIYFPEYPILYHMFGFNTTILLRFENISKEIQDSIKLIFKIFPMGKFLFSFNTIIVILYYDYNREFRRKLDQFLKFHNLSPKIDPILNLLEIDPINPFFKGIQ